MRKRINLRLMAIVCIMMMGVLGGCSNHTDSDQKEKNTFIKDLTYQDFSAFTNIKDYAIPCTFESTKKPDDWENPYDITGSYDLDQDGNKDAISVHCNQETFEYRLQINDAIYEDYLASPQTFYIIDLDTRDSCMDLVLYDFGMSADPNFNFYRYDGKEITYLGTIGSISDSTIAFDGYGRVTQGDSLLYRLNPSIMPDYYQLVGKEFEYIKFNLNDLLNKDYVLGSDEAAYFHETDQILDDFIPDWSETEAIELKAGETITIKEIYEYQQYRIVLPDGRSGMLYYWIGD